MWNGSWTLCQTPTFPAYNIQEDSDDLKRIQNANVQSKSHLILSCFVGSYLERTSKKFQEQAQIKIFPFRVFIALLYLGPIAQRLPFSPSVSAIHFFPGRKAQAYFRREKVVDVMIGHIAWDLRHLFHIPADSEKFLCPHVFRSPVP